MLVSTQVEQVGNTRSLGSRFVYTTADGSNLGALKARCVQGYMDPAVLETASPTLSAEGFAAAQLITSMGWTMKIADIEGAFLRGEN